MQAFVHNYKVLLAAGVVLVAAGGTLRVEAAVEGAASAPEAAAPAAAPAVAAARVTAPAPAAEEDERVARVEAAVSKLARVAGRTSDTRALRYAFQAYFAYRAEHPEDVTKPYLYFVDYGLSNRTPRGWVFDMDALEVVEGPFNVAHGRGSGPRNGVPTKFTNRSGSATSSLGLYRAAETYAFSGKANGRYYRSIGLRMDGVSGSFNSAARARGVVAHGAPYVSSRDAGRSEGCPAMEEFRAQRLLPLIANGGMVFVFSPADPGWLQSDPWISALAD